MSILVSGMKMPRFGECIVITSDGVASKYLDGDVAIYYAARPDKEAAAVELPPHGRLGDLDAMMAKDAADFAEAMNATSSVSTRSLMRQAHDAIQKAIGETEVIIPADPEGGADG